MYYLRHKELSGKAAMLKEIGLALALNLSQCVGAPHVDNWCALPKATSEAVGPSQLKSSARSHFNCANCAKFSTMHDQCMPRPCDESMQNWM